MQWNYKNGSTIEQSWGIKIHFLQIMILKSIRNGPSLHVKVWCPVKPFFKNIYWQKSPFKIRICKCTWHTFVIICQSIKTKYLKLSLMHIKVALSILRKNIVFLRNDRSSAFQWNRINISSVIFFYILTF